MDKLELYRWGVQDPVTHARVLAVMYQRLYPGCVPVILREDFAGTSAEAVAWVALQADRQALAIDLDAPTLAWARRRAERLLGPRAAAVQFHEADVLTLAPPEVPAAHIISALNFSVFYYLQRPALRAYLQHARRALDEQGILVMNAFGGPGAMRAHTDRHRVEPRNALPGEATIAPFEYLWEQGAYDAVSGHITCRIHFVLPGQPPLRDAFIYDWRLWTLPELTEIALEAGFRDVQIWRHTYDPAKGASGVFLGAVPAIENLETWVAYIVAIP